MSESTWTQPSERFDQTTQRYDDERSGWRFEMAIVAETWSQFMDWNGDGRVDVIDAKGGSDNDHWRVWINEDDGVGGIQWLTGIEPKGAQAHHTLPVKYEGWFRKAGLNIHDPKFGAWWDGGPHQRSASSCDADFDRFRTLNPNATSGQILAFGRSLAQKYGFDVLY